MFYYGYIASKSPALPLKCISIPFTFYKQILINAFNSMIFNVNGLLCLRRPLPLFVKNITSLIIIFFTSTRIFVYVFYRYAKLYSTIVHDRQLLAS